MGGRRDDIAERDGDDHAIEVAGIPIHRIGQDRAVEAKAAGDVGRAGRDLIDDAGGGRDAGRAERRDDRIGDGRAPNRLGRAAGA